jgi:hypothetical protein
LHGVGKKRTALRQRRETLFAAAAAPWERTLRAAVGLS